MKSLIAGLALLTALPQLSAAAEGLTFNYSLWPRRPEAIANAQGLIYQQKLDEALALLLPYISKDDIGGKEARALTSLINLPRYLSLANPHIKLYSVVSGDQIVRVASKNKTPKDLLYMLNGTTNPSRLKIGQKMIVTPMDLLIELHLPSSELRLWDGDILVYAGALLKVSGAPKETQELSLEARNAFKDGRRLSEQTIAYTSANRALKLSDGSLILGDEALTSQAATYRIDQRELNAISLLLTHGTKVRVVCEKGSN